MAQELDYADDRLQQCRKLFCDSSITLAVLAVVRRREVTISEACSDITRYSASVLIMDEARVSREIHDLVKQGYAERNGERYHITTEGKNFMFDMLKVWNQYVDAMNNLWGCYYGA